MQEASRSLTLFFLGLASIFAAMSIIDIKGRLKAVEERQATIEAKQSK